MKALLNIFLCCLLSFSVVAQGEVDAMRKAAQSKMQENKFDEALQILASALLVSPGNVDVMKDQMFYAFLSRDYAKSIDIGKELITNPASDAQAFQILGMCYKAIADTKEGDKLYRAGIKKFPSSGVLYSEYGDMLMSNKDISNAIKQWEKGIEMDPGYSGNYYYLSKQYAQSGNIIWGLLYGEIFVNIESLTKRTAEIKAQVAGGYQKLLENKNAITALKKDGTVFEKTVVKCLSAAALIADVPMSVESLSAFRSRFIYLWNNEAPSMPFRLFEHHTQLLQDGMFDAYNQWLFHAADDADYQNWKAEHAAEDRDFRTFQQNVLFKIPKGQYYTHN